MQITKFGHSCLLVEIDGVRMLFDPGDYSSIQNNVNGLDAILLTHKHRDHLDPALLKNLIERNPNSAIYACTETQEELTQHGITSQSVGDNDVLNVKEISVKVYSTQHQFIYPTVPLPENVSYLIQNKLLITGDSFAYPEDIQVEILALPVVAPWMRLQESIDFALKLKPKKVFPVHDGFLKITGPFHALPKEVLANNGIEFIVIGDGETVNM